MCRVIQVSRSGYYGWLNHSDSNRVKQDKDLVILIKLIFAEGRGNYGSRTIKKKLEQKGHFISRRRVIRLMNQENLICKTRKKFKATTDSNHKLPIAPNLLDRQFRVLQPNQCYVGDITYIATGEGWLYLATVIDLYSRKVVGWSMADNMKAELVNKALLMAIWQRKPPKGLVWHTDRRQSIRIC
jgi:putative transposase